MASSDVVKKPPSRRTPAAGRAGRAMAVLGGVRRTTLLFLLAAVVLSLGMVAGNGSGEDRSASFSEIAQTDARAAALALTRQAGELADAESSETLAAELSRQAAVLDEQSVLLTRAGSFRSGVPPFPAAPSGAVPASDADTDSRAAAYVRSLTDSARASLDAALRADAGTARLLAATGAAQQVLAVRAAEAAGLDAPEPWTPLPQADGGSRCESGATASPGSPSAAAEGTAGGTADGTADGDSVPDAAAALQGAVDAEFGAAYAYEVGMARTAGAGERALLEERREDHLAAGAEGVHLLPEVCLPALTRAPAYSLPPSFAADPGDALDSLEASLPGVYADLAALGAGPVRAWAVERLAELSAGLYAEEGSVPAAPGLDLEPAGLPRTPGTA
ncbi:DUF4439 domain-containing protein [Arthrobacter sp. G119Y2]|uniref:DUF4439 domain-containing protein n=1 Tax=Arthrobacter sp. G119Y2 TaxID=3134965 RepID=UPI003119674A